MGGDVDCAMGGTAGGLTYYQNTGTAYKNFDVEPWATNPGTPGIGIPPEFNAGLAPNAGGNPFGNLGGDARSNPTCADFDTDGAAPPMGAQSG
jgi:hypothetical protein